VPSHQTSCNFCVKEEAFTNGEEDCSIDEEDPTSIIVPDTPHIDLYAQENSKGIEKGTAVQRLMSEAVGGLHIVDSSYTFDQLYLPL